MAQTTTPEASPVASVAPETWPSALPGSPASVDPQSRYTSAYAATDPFTPAAIPTGVGAWPSPSIDSPFPPSGIFGGAGQSPPAAGQRRDGVRRKSLITGSIIVVVVIVAIGGLLATVGSHGPTYPAKWNPRVLAMVHFVEHERGLSFIHPVKVEFLSSARFNQEVAVPQPNSEATGPQRPATSTNCGRWDWSTAT